MLIVFLSKLRGFPIITCTFVLFVGWHDQVNLSIGSFSHNIHLLGLSLVGVFVLASYAINVHVLVAIKEIAKLGSSLPLSSPGYFVTSPKRYKDYGPVAVLSTPHIHVYICVHINIDQKEGKEEVGVAC